jgi:ABC-type polysaccharide/polyol phosphate transport system ATPase subunit
MSMTTIQFEQVSKKYRQRHAGRADADLWALKDVDFACGEGEVLGLVGRNGCGKSTLLKLAAGVTAPTGGKVTTVKPIAPMLELGAGFHPDLTGRDNIRLNGSLLGLGRRLSKSQFDEIVRFAELEEHVDTPVKHYSSGMSARLGFAIAVHSPARLLLVDEVLSVGDKLFQQKCLERMTHLRDHGTTIVLVSHDDWWIRNFCTRALLFDAGRVVADTTPDDALRQYDLRLYKAQEDSQNGVSVGRVEVFDAGGAAIGQLEGAAIRVRIAYDAQAAGRAWVLVARVRREDGVYCAMCIAEAQALPDAGTAVVEIDDLLLVVGRYVVEVSIEDAATQAALATQVSESFFVPGLFDMKRGYDGIIRVRHRWSLEGRD